MSTETLEHLFEPFYTTKDVGKGTGLGLATCYGIITQSGGTISVASSPGRGSTFRIRLPLGEPHETSPQTPPASVPASSLIVGRTVLLAEDDPLVREFTAVALRKGGYHVLAAADGATALKLALAHRGRLDLLLTDVVMPGMTGRQLAIEVRHAWPDIAVLYATGYEPGTVTASSDALPGSQMIQKPFTASELLEAIDKLNARSPGSPIATS
jgi:CheY-like chemotaxis protein